MLTANKPVGTSSSINILPNFLRHRLINLQTFTAPYRWLFGFVLSLLVSAGIMLTFSHTLEPRVTFALDSQSSTVIALPIYLFVVASFACGWILVLVAATRMPLLARLVTSLFALGILADVPLQRLLAYVRTDDGASAMEVSLRLAQIALLTFLAYWEISGRASPGQGDAERASSWRRFIPVGVIVLLLVGYHAVDVTAALAVFSSSSGTGNISHRSPGLQVGYLVTLLTIIVYWGSTDFIEWAESAAHSVGVAAHRFHTSRLFFVLVAAIAVANILDLFRAISMSYLLVSSVTTLLLIAVITAIALYSRIDASWQVQVPLPGLLAGVGVIYVLFQVLAVIAPPRIEYKLYTVLTVSFSFVVLGAALIVIRLGRRRQQSNMRASGYFVAVLVSLFLSLSVPQTAYVFGISASAATQGSVPAIRFIVSIGTLLGLLTLLLLGRLRRNLLTPMIYVLALFAGLQVISIYLLYILPYFNSYSTPLVVITAVLFLCAILWDLLMSGDQVTNSTSPNFPRQTRLLFYLGYTLISSATILFFKAQSVPGDVLSLGGGISVETVGGLMLGVPLIAYLFIRNIGSWWVLVPHRAARPKETSIPMR
jgi:hypothetical protein